MAVSQSARSHADAFQDRRPVRGRRGSANAVKREVLGGSLLHVSTELLELKRRSLRFVHWMYDSETNEEVASTELVGVYFDIENRASVPLPDIARERAALLVTKSAG